MSEVWKMNKSIVKRYIKADSGRLSAVLEYASGTRVDIPLNSDGSVKWFDDSKLIKSK